MELRAAVESRRMLRALRPDPLPDALLLDLLDRARRAPSAGNAAAVAFVVLEGAAVARYWDVTLPEGRRASFAWPSLLSAPALVVVTTEPQAYVRRYAEDDKARSGLGHDQAAWPVPFWWVDAGCVIQNLLLLATDAGLGALLFGAFEHEAALRCALGIPEEVRIVGSVALGFPDEPGRAGRSARRARPDLAAVVHRGSW